MLSRSLGERANQILLGEARVLARLEHPHILSVHDCVEHQDHLYLIREYLEGQTLASWLKSLHPGGLPAPSKVLAIAKSILKGLAYAHERGVIHRYIHPKNIILGDQVKIMNFGLADHPEETWSPAQVVYMSPEQLAQRELSVRSDLYSFGVLLYTLLTGQPPFGADTIEELIDQCIYAAPVPPTEINQGIPVPLERTILQLLSKDPRSRQFSARVVLEELSETKPWQNAARSTTPSCYEERLSKESA